MENQSDKLKRLPVRLPEKPAEKPVEAPKDDASEAKRLFRHRVTDDLPFTVRRAGEKPR